MPSAPTHRSAPTILIAGASRGLGLAMAAEFLRRHWAVVGTARARAGTALHGLAADHAGRLEVEMLDIIEPDQVAALRTRLTGRVLDMLFVNAGTATRDEHARMGSVGTDEFMRVMVTNALGPLRVIEALQDLVPAGGLIGVMSSGQGSIGNNETGQREVYRASKAALNMAVRSFAARPDLPPRATVLMAPGWIRTELGGPDAPFGIEESVPAVVDVLLAQRETPGLRYLDRFGRTVPW